MRRVRGLRLRLALVGTVFCTLLLFLYRQEAEINAVTPLQLPTSSFQNDKSDGDEDSTVLDLQHPSVFQQWRSHQPPPTHHSLHKDCSIMHGEAMQTLCTQQLNHVQNYCHKRWKESDPLQAIVQERRGSGEEGRGHDRTRKNGVNSSVGVRDVGGDGESEGVEEGVVDVFSYRHGKTVMMFCSVHKVASTFWIRLFRFLHRDPSSALVSSPEAISKYNVHLTPFNQSRPLALAYVRRMLRPGDEEFRFMFTRDPYSRLWAVYIDKFVLPDFFFWTSHVSAIKEERFKKTHPKEKRRYFNICSDIEFEEFVQYAVGDLSSPVPHSDNHILPISKTCDPCSFDPNFIGRLENMVEASQAVLERLNLTSFSKPHSFQEHILAQIRATTEFVYETVIGTGNLRHCVTDEELLNRLLKAFVLSGYLPPGVTWERAPPSLARSVMPVVKMAQALFLKHTRTAQQVQKQKKMFFVKAYKSLPHSLLQRVRDYYQEDFDSFGYDSEPPELFSDQKIEV